MYRDQHIYSMFLITWHTPHYKQALKYCYATPGTLIYICSVCSVCLRISDLCYKFPFPYFRVLYWEWIFWNMVSVGE